MGGVETVAAVRADLAARLPLQNKKQREGLALLVATALDVRDVNLMELAAALPRAAERLDMRDADPTTFRALRVTSIRPSGRTGPIGSARGSGRASGDL